MLHSLTHSAFMSLSILLSVRQTLVCIRGGENSWCVTTKPTSCFSEEWDGASTWMHLGSQGTLQIISCWRVNVFGTVCPKASVKDSPAIHCLDNSECMLRSLWNGTLVSPGFRLVSPGAQVWGHMLRKETVHVEVAFHGLVGQQRLFVWLRVRGCDVYLDL